MWKLVRKQRSRKNNRLASGIGKSFVSGNSSQLIDLFSAKRQLHGPQIVAVATAAARCSSASQIHFTVLGRRFRCWWKWFTALIGFASFFTQGKPTSSASCHDLCGLCERQLAGPSICYIVVARYRYTSARRHNWVTKSWSYWMSVDRQLHREKRSGIKQIQSYRYVHFIEL